MIIFRHIKSVRIYYLAILALIAAGASPAVAGDPLLDTLIVSQTGNIWTTVSNFGRYGDPDAALPSWEWPGGGASNYLWEGRLWIGARVNEIPHVTTADYGDYEWHSALDDPSFIGPVISDEDILVYYDDDFNIGTIHFPMYLRVEQRFLSWSSVEHEDFQGIALLVINYGSYDLEEVYVSFCFDHDVATIDPTEPHKDDWVDFDGEDGIDSDTDRRDWIDPMDLDGDEETGYDEYGWPWADPLNPQYDPEQAEGDGIYDEYIFWEDLTGPEVLGQPGTIYEGIVLTDSLGNPLHGYLLSRGLSYMLDGDNPSVPWEDTGERFMTPPATGFCGTSLLYCPTDSTVNPWSHQWWNWNNDPDDDIERYEFMNGTHPSANGRRFLPRPNELGEPIWDYRYMISSGPFNLNPGETIWVVAAFCAGEGLEGIRACADRALEWYYEGSLWSSPLDPSSPDEDWHWNAQPVGVQEEDFSTIPATFKLNPPSPNPFNSTVALSYSLESPALVDLGVYNAQGQKLANIVKGYRSVGTHIVNWDPTDNSSGLLFFHLKANNQTKVAKGVLLK
jgi:hypothetical protein